VEFAESIISFCLSLILENTQPDEHIQVNHLHGALFLSATFLFNTRQQGEKKN
jgi:hypothetical protein